MERILLISIAMLAGVRLGNASMYGHQQSLSHLIGSSSEIGYVAQIQPAYTVMILYGPQSSHNNHQSHSSNSYSTPAKNLLPSYISQKPTAFPSPSYGSNPASMHAASAQHIDRYQNSHSAPAASSYTAHRAPVAALSASYGTPSSANGPHSAIDGEILRLVQEALALPNPAPDFSHVGHDAGHYAAGFHHVGTHHAGSDHTGPHYAGTHHAGTHHAY